MIHINFPRTLTALTALTLPSSMARPVLRALGHSIGHGVRIGFSILLCDRLQLAAGANVGHLNVFALRVLKMATGSRVGRTNVAIGPLSIVLSRGAALGNGNRIVRAPMGTVTTGPSALRLGELTKLTSRHYIDCTRSVRIGDFSIIAGVGSQIWTHGYVHEIEGAGRYRVDGEVRIGANVYVGSRCVVTAGVRIGNGTMVGAGATVSGNLDPHAFYVSAPLRKLPRPGDPAGRADLTVVGEPALVETVYSKHLAP